MENMSVIKTKVGWVGGGGGDAGLNKIKYFVTMGFVLRFKMQL